MDTVNRYVSAASTALWGENTNTESQNVAHGDEPMSGVQGKGVANDPYDAGNREVEQPDAPKFESNTAPQEPKLGDTPLNTAEPAMADNSIGAIAGGSGAGSSDSPLSEPTESLITKPTESLVPVVPVVPEQRSTEESAVTKKQELGNQDQDIAVSNAAENNTTKNNTAENNSNESNAAENNIDNPESKTAEDKAENNDDLPAPPHNKDVSEEALKGPQGPAPKPAEQFEKEEKMKQKKPAESRTSGDSAKSSNSDDKATNGSGDKKHSTMAKVKETLHKVAHPRHGNNKA